MKLSGRNDEINDLEQLYKSDRPEFLALYGRRRIGKTFLIKQFFSNKKEAIFFNVTGAKDGTFIEQIKHFVWQIGKVFYGGAALKIGKNWDETFEILTNAIEKEDRGKKIVLFFDELPWMATRNSRLLQSIDYYWNQHWSNDSRIKLIVCGSSASWIIHKIIKNKGGLYNRITRKMHLEPFKLNETKLFLEQSGVKLNNEQLLLLYMVTGGIPYYLSHVKPGLSAMQIIEALAFSKGCLLLEEFDEIFASLFDDHDDHIRIIRAIASRRYGIGKNELLKKLGPSLMGKSGIKKLQEIEESGFVVSFKPHFHKRQGLYYRLTDEYTAFYLKWIEPLRQTLQAQSLDKGNWQSIQHSSEWYNWLGYAFETVCYKHISEIRHALSINPGAIANSWRYVPRKEDSMDNKGAQIDLLFDRKDGVITLCEIKYTNNPFVIDKTFAVNLANKIEVFKQKTRTKKQIFMVMISANGLKKTIYSEEMITGLVTLDDLIKKIHG